MCRPRCRHAAWQRETRLQIERVLSASSDRGQYRDSRHTSDLQLLGRLMPMESLGKSDSANRKTHENKGSARSWRTSASIWVVNALLSRKKTITTRSYLRAWDTPVA